MKRVLIKLTFIIALVSLASRFTHAQSDCEWMKNLPLYDINHGSSSSDDRRAQADYMCSITEESRRQQRGGSRGTSVGLSYGGFGGSFGSRSTVLRSDEFEKFDSYCRNRTGSSATSEDIASVIMTINRDMARALDSCINRTGLRVWIGLSAGGRFVTIHLSYIPDSSTGSAKILRLTSSANITCDDGDVQLASQPFSNVKRTIRCERNNLEPAQIVINTDVNISGSDGVFSIPEIQKQNPVLPSVSQPSLLDVIGDQRELLEAQNWETYYISQGGRILSYDYLSQVTRKLGLAEVTPHRYDLRMCRSCRLAISFFCKEEIRVVDDLRSMKVRTEGRESIMKKIEEYAIAVPLPSGEVFTAIGHGIVDCTAYPVYLPVSSRN